MNASLALLTEQSRYGIRETSSENSPIVPELLLVGHVNYHTARPSFFNKHQHPDVLEIFYIARGKVTWWVEGVSTEVGRNELFLVWPHELHGAKNNVVEPAEYYWIQIHLPLLRRSLGNKASVAWKDELLHSRERHLIGTPELLPLYQLLLKEHAAREAGCLSIVRESLHLLLSFVMRCSLIHRSAAAQKNHYQHNIDRALQWAKEQLAESSLEGMLAASGMDSTSFRREFSTRVGLTPSQYLIRVRLQHAKEQLAREVSVTEIAHHLGFSSTQYFATVFRKFEGMSPSDFLIKIKEGVD